MVQFGHALAANAVLEWRPYYINYNKLKALISGIVSSSAASSHGGGGSGGDFPAMHVHPENKEEKIKSKWSGPETSLLSAALSPQMNFPGGSAAAAGTAAGTGNSGSSQLHIEHQFLKACEDEANKVDNFFVQKCEECKERLELLRDAGTGITNRHSLTAIDPSANRSPIRSRISELRDHEEGGSRQRALSVTSDPDDGAHEQAATSITRAMTELYREVCLLENFAVLNFTGFIKITKKFRKAMGKLTADTRRRRSTISASISAASASTGKATSKAVMADVKGRSFADHTAHVQALVTGLELLYARNFTGGDRSVARALLLVKQKPRSDWYMFRLGLHAGMLMMLLFWVIWQNLSPMSDSVEALLLHPALPVFRLCACAVILQWCWGLNIYVWKHARINYIFLFGLDPDTTYTHEQVFFEACNNSIVLLFTVLIFGKMREHAISFGGLAPGILPLLLLTFLCYRFLRSSGFLSGLLSRVGGWWCKGQGDDDDDDGGGAGGHSMGRVFPELCRTLAAPFSSVTFMSAYLGDFLTSLVKPLVDAAYSVCSLAPPQHHTCWRCP